MDGFRGERGPLKRSPRKSDTGSGRLGEAAIKHDPEKWKPVFGIMLYLFSRAIRLEVSQRLPPIDCTSE